MMKKIIDEMIEALASEIRKDGAFEEFKKQAMKDRSFVEFLKQKEKKECDCENCKIVDKLINNIEGEILKSDLKTEALQIRDPAFSFIEVDYAIERKKEARLKFKKALKNYASHVLAVDYLKKSKENSNG
jgi:hypothetical protein